VQVGVDTDHRGSLTIGRSVAGRAFGKLIASHGGDFVAYLDALLVGVAGHAGAGSGRTDGILDLAAMASCTIDTLAMSVGTDQGPAWESIGSLRLPPGTVKAGDVMVGGAGKGHGLIAMRDTAFTVANAIAVHPTGEMVVEVSSESGGLLVANADTDALTVADGATITLRFLEPPATPPHYALAWAGAHGAALEAMLAAGKLIIKDEGLGGKRAQVYSRGGTTYVGLPPPADAILVFP